MRETRRRPESATAEGVPIDSETRGSEMPEKRLKSATPRIGHLRGCFDRFGGARGRRFSVKSSNLRCLKSANAEGASVDSENLRVEDAQ